jgi:hypothetical protein
VSSCTCQCCEKRKPCARVLQLDEEQQEQLTGLRKLIGENTSRGRYVRKAISVSSVMRDDEPTTTIKCSDCGRPHVMLVYLVDFLKSQHTKLPTCPACLGAGQ